MRLSGSITALATPFTAAGELDLDAWRRLLQMQREGGTQGVVVAGSTGEAPALFDSEYDALLRAAVEEINDVSWSGNIGIPPGTYTLGLGDIDITGSPTISGAGAVTLNKGGHEI